MSTTMSITLAVVVLLNIAFFLWLMYATGKRHAGEVADGEVKEHVWDDDLCELNNPMPRWWLNLFIITIVFSLGYWVLYPGLGAFEGMLDWSSRSEMEARLATYEERQQRFLATFAGRDIPDLATDEAARARGASLFGQHCAGCHGAQAKGAIGYPNLTDGDWQYGGAPEQILTSIREGRVGYMTPFAGRFSDKQIDALVALVGDWPVQARAAKNQSAMLDQATAMALFRQHCAACHGADGRGNALIGAPNLTDDIWLYGGAPDQLRQTIVQGRNGQMPAQKSLLGETEIRLLAAWLYGLSR